MFISVILELFFGNAQSWLFDIVREIKVRLPMN